MWYKYDIISSYIVHNVHNMISVCTLNTKRWLFYLFINDACVYHMDVSRKTMKITDHVWDFLQMISHWDWQGSVFQHSDFTFHKKARFSLVNKTSKEVGTLYFSLTCFCLKRYYM